MSIAQGALAVARKEFRHMRHDPLTLGLTVGVPVMQLILFGFAIQTRIQHVPIAVLNHDKHSASRALLDNLGRSEQFSITHYVSSETELRSLMRAGRVSAAIEIPDNYSAGELYRQPAMLQLWVDGTDGTTAIQVVSAVEGIELGESMGRLLAARAPAVPAAPVEVRPRTLFAPDIRDATALLPGLIGILMQMIPLLLTALSITKEKERGTWDQVRVTPLSTGSLVTGKLLAFGCVGFAEGCALLLLTRVVFGIPIHGNLILAIASLALFLLPSLGLGLLITARARHQAEALQLSYLVFLPSVLLSGLLFSRSSMPAPIYWFSSLLPTTYFVQIMRGIVNRGAGFFDLLPEFAAVVIFAAAILTVAYRLVYRSAS